MNEAAPKPRLPGEKRPKTAEICGDEPFTGGDEPLIIPLQKILRRRL
jgi:hypothetical protein